MSEASMGGDKAEIVLVFFLTVLFMSRLACYADIQELLLTIIGLA
ncbi:MAG: hypothetical protein QW506_03015 [Thermoproteota archaeon]